MCSVQDVFWGGGREKKKQLGSSVNRWAVKPEKCQPVKFPPRGLGEEGRGGNGKARLNFLFVCSGGFEPAWCFAKVALQRSVPGEKMAALGCVCVDS